MGRLMAGEFTRQFAVRKPNGELVASPYTGKTLLWDCRETAEHVMEHFAAQAAEMGITEWLGEIVYQLVTPFVSDGDPTEHLVDELTAWMREQGGLS